MAVRKRKSGTVVVPDPDAGAQKNAIEAAYTHDRLPVWTEDEAGPSQTLPSPGSPWHPGGQPVRHPHEYVRDGPVTQLTLFCPARGQVRVKGGEAHRTPCSILGCKPS